MAPRQHLGSPSPSLVCRILTLTQCSKMPPPLWHVIRSAQCSFPTREDRVPTNEGIWWACVQQNGAECFCGVAQECKLCYEGLTKGRLVDLLERCRSQEHSLITFLPTQLHLRISFQGHTSCDVEVPYRRILGAPICQTKEIRLYIKITEDTRSRNRNTRGNFESFIAAYSLQRHCHQEEISTPGPLTSGGYRRSQNTEGLKQGFKEIRKLRPKVSLTCLASHSSNGNQILRFCLSLSGITLKRPPSPFLYTSGSQPTATLPLRGHLEMSGGIFG
ncbi:uncharacterized protein LOC111168720 [Delphinapterus leucas]|uniref:Uncharacterized protein LOC111168720 n=1 Tax=Delphinapterus leucas TaxID=9749 RepID=A0A2Y9MLR7_DELLE|nr:uncharacterized protein LOC111168720 [Delphinapterus leucas]